MNIENLRKRQGPIIIAAVIIVTIIAAAIFIFAGGSKSAQVFKDVAVVRGDIEVTILSTGIVQPENRLAIKPPIAGRIEKVMVEEGDVVKKGQILVLMSSVERAALLDAAHARGPEELAKWDSFYRPAPILAPIDGTIILRSVEPGQSFTTQEAVLVMSDRLTVKAQVDETDIAQIKLEQKAAVILDAYSEKEIPAHVDKIAYDATTVNNVTTYIVDVLPDETPDYMRSGMTANVRFDVGSVNDVLILPANAVKNKKGQHFVMMKDTRLEKEVEVGVTNGKLLEITSGLKEGDVVLVVQPNSLAGQNPNGQSPLSPFRPPAKKQ